MPSDSNHPRAAILLPSTAVKRYRRKTWQNKREEGRKEERAHEGRKETHGKAAHTQLILLAALHEALSQQIYIIY